MFPFQDVMIDIETLGTAPGAKILTIGAVFFSRETAELSEPFYLALDPVKTPGTVSRSTFRWWKSQPQEAQEAAFGGTVDPAKGMHMLAEYVNQAKNVKPWGNGSVFDITMLEWLFTETGVGIPWDFWNIRDMRTVMDLAGRSSKDFPFEGTAHNALDDAVHQAKIVSRLLRDMKA